MRDAFFKRALKLYVCQAALLVFLLGVIGLVGVAMHQPAITDLVSFFLDNPMTALLSGLLLLYNPPLLDILPMYVLFMILSPLLLLHASRHGWGAIVVVSGLVWLAAQFGLSQAGYDALVRLTGMPVPFRETGAFEMLAWQFVWVLGLWIGSSHGARQPVAADAVPDLGGALRAASTRWSTWSGAMRSGRRRFRTIRSSACSTTSGSSARCA